MGEYLGNLGYVHLQARSFRVPSLEVSDLFEDSRAGFVIHNAGATI